MDHDLLADEYADRLVAACSDSAADHLRSVTYFTQDDFEQLYLRQDLQQDADLTTFIGLEWREADITENAYRGTELGEHVYTMRRFENGYLLRVATGRYGVFATVDDLSLSTFEELATALDAEMEALHGADA